VEAFLRPEALGRYSVERRDEYEGNQETDQDRVVLDVPEPWHVVPHAEGALCRGGILVAYLPGIMQVAQLRAALAASAFAMAETTEVLVRAWHVEGQAVRPQHRMVAHTGFLTSARLMDQARPPTRP
jgi:tRNA (adenine57-N1/adenine58-N1)-methyltransferase